MDLDRNRQEVRIPPLAPHERQAERPPIVRFLAYVDHEADANRRLRLVVSLLKEPAALFLVYVAAEMLQVVLVLGTYAQDYAGWVTWSIRVGCLVASLVWTIAAGRAFTAWGEAIEQQWGEDIRHGWERALEV